MPFKAPYDTPPTTVAAYSAAQRHACSQILTMSPAAQDDVHQIDAFDMPQEHECFCFVLPGVVPMASNTMATAIIQMNHPKTTGRGILWRISAQSPTTPQAKRPMQLHTDRIETSALYGGQELKHASVRLDSESVSR